MSSYCGTVVSGCQNPSFLLLPCVVSDDDFYFLWYLFSTELVTCLFIVKISCTFDMVSSRMEMPHVKALWRYKESAHECALNDYNHFHDQTSGDWPLFGRASDWSLRKINHGTNHPASVDSFSFIGNLNQTLEMKNGVESVFYVVLITWSGLFNCVLVDSINLTAYLYCFGEIAEKIHIPYDLPNAV